MKPTMQKQYTPLGFPHKIIAVIGGQRFDLNNLEESERAVMAAYIEGIDDRMIEECLR